MEKTSLACRCLVENSPRVFCSLMSQYVCKTVGLCNKTKIWMWIFTSSFLLMQWSMDYGFNEAFGKQFFKDKYSFRAKRIHCPEKVPCRSCIFPSHSDAGLLLLGRAPCWGWAWQQLAEDERLSSGSSQQLLPCLSKWGLCRAEMVFMRWFLYIK